MLHARETRCCIVGGCRYEVRDVTLLPRCPDGRSKLHQGDISVRIHRYPWPHTGRPRDIGSTRGPRWIRADDFSANSSAHCLPPEPRDWLRGSCRQTPAPSRCDWFTIFLDLDSILSVRSAKSSVTGFLIWTSRVGATPRALASIYIMRDADSKAVFTI